MSESMSDLYRSRAWYAEFENDVADMRKYMRTGGIRDRILAWLEREARAGRLQVQAEIDMMNAAERPAPRRRPRSSGEG